MHTMILLLVLTGCGLNPITHAPVDDTASEDDFMMIGDVRVSPSEVRFGAVSLEGSATVEVSLTNLGDSDAELSSAYLEGDTAYTLTTASPELMPSGASASVVVTFEPDAEQDYTGTLNLLIAGESEIAALPITGAGSTTVDTDTDTGNTGGTGDGLVLESALVEFGKVPIGTTAARSVEVTNEGSEDILISSVTSTVGVFLGDLGVPLVLSPGESEDLLIQYIPTQEVSTNATLTIINDSGDQPEVDVTGSGYEACDICEPRLSVITGGTDSYTMDQFKATALDNPNEQTLFVSNVGDVDLEITAIDIINDTEVGGTLICGRDGNYSLGTVSLPLTIPENGSASIPVRYRYDGAEAFCGEFSIDSGVNVLTITSNSGTGSSLSISLGGGYSVF
jgi:hypothetical protein